MSALEQLARRVGRPVDGSDEHDRLALYRSVADDDAHRDDLLAALAEEPDVLVATDVLAALMERVLPEDRDRLVEVVAPDGRNFLASRLADLARLDRLAAPGGSDDRALAAEVIEAGDWLQRRVVEQSDPGAVLEALAERGRTRRVRARAAARGRS